MTYDLSALSVSSIMTNATSALSSIAPYLELLVGVLLAFMIIRYIVTAIRGTPKYGDDYENDIYP